MPASEIDLQQRLATAIAALPGLQREILIAHRLEGLSYRQIASRTGLTQDDVERQMAEAISKLAKQLDGEKLRWWERWF